MSLKKIFQKLPEFNLLQVKLVFRLSSNELSLSFSIRKTLLILVLLSYLDHLIAPH